MPYIIKKHTYKSISTSPTPKEPTIAAIIVPSITNANKINAIIVFPPHYGR